MYENILEKSMGILWAVLELIGSATPGGHDRVAAGTLEMADDPRTVM